MQHILKRLGSVDSAYGPHVNGHKLETLQEACELCRA